MSNTLTGTDKSVILLMTIGEDRAAEVFKHLSQREVQILSAAMANVRQISNKQLTEVLSEFEQEAEQFAALNVNANDYLRSVLVKALGEERAASLLEDILETRDTASGIETLNFMEPQAAADLIRDEHPQIIATILVHLKRGQAADILALFDERLRHDVMLRIATFGGVQPAALAELTEVLNNLLDGQNLKRSKMGGVRTAAEIINLMKTQQEEAVIRGGSRVRRRTGAENHRRDVPVRKPGGSGRPQHPAPAAGSGLRVAAYRPERCRAAAAREVPAQHVPACGRYPARRPCQPWPGASVSGGKRTESDPAYCSSSGGNRRDGDWQRRRHLCLMSYTARAWQRWQPDDLGAPQPPEPELLLADEPDNDLVLSEEDEQQQQLERLQQQMRKDAQTQGYSEGYQKGFARRVQQTGLWTPGSRGRDWPGSGPGQQQAPIHARMQQLVSEFQHTLDALDSVIASRLMQMALEAARQVIGQTPVVDNRSR